MKTIAIRLSDVEAAMLKEVAGRHSKHKGINEFVANKIKEEFSRDPRFK